MSAWILHSTKIWCHQEFEDTKGVIRIRFKHVMQFFTVPWPILFKFHQIILNVYLSVNIYSNMFHFHSSRIQSCHTPSQKQLQGIPKNVKVFYSIKVGQSFWSKISLTVVTIKVSSKTLSKFSLTKKTLIATKGLYVKKKVYKPIRILFWNDEMMFTKQKHMIIKRRERENQQDE
jgi:hypothetical protein